MTDTTTIEIKYVLNYDLWRRGRETGKVSGFADGEVHLGYFQFITKNHTNGGDAVAVWVENGAVAASINGKVIVDHYNVFQANSADNRRWLPELMQWCVHRPVSEDDYWKRIETGTWPGQHEAVTAQQDRLGIGGNNPPPDDSFEGLGDQIKSLAAEVQALLNKGAAQTKEEADRAGDLSAALGRLYTKADKAKDTEKRPFLDKCQEIEDKWRPLRHAAEIYKKVKAVVITPWQIAADRERLRKLAAERAEADRIAREAAEAQRRADIEAQSMADWAARGDHVDEEQNRLALEESAREADRLKEQAEAAARQADQTARSTVKVGGTRGKAIALKSFLVLEVKDRRAASGALRDQPGFLDDLDELLKKHARPLIQAGQQVPGIESKTEQRAA